MSTVLSRMIKRIMFIVLAITITTNAYSQDSLTGKFIAYELQEATFNGKEWVWGDFKVVNEKAEIHKGGVFVGQRYFLYIQDDPDGLTAENCKVSKFSRQTTGERCIILIHKFPSGTKTLSIMYPEKILRYLIE